MEGSLSACRTPSQTDTISSRGCYRPLFSVCPEDEKTFDVMLCGTKPQLVEVPELRYQSDLK
jgi:hypothetical protein